MKESLFRSIKNNFLEFKESKVVTQMKAQFPNSLSLFTIANDIIGKSDALSGLSCSQGEVEGEVGESKKI